MKHADRRAGGDDAGQRETGTLPIPGVDLQAIVHELESRQVELEMQIEELRQARAEAEDLRARYEELFDFAPLGYLTLDNKGLVVDANLAAAALLGFERSALTGQSLVGLAAPACRAGLAGFLSEVRQSPGRRSAEVRIIPRRGPAVDVVFEAVLLWGREASDDLVELALVDVTERRLAEVEKSLLAREPEAKAGADDGRPRISKVPSSSWG